MYNILVVEDEIAIAELIELNLKKAGYNCEYVLDGAKVVREPVFALFIKKKN